MDRFNPHQPDYAQQPRQAAPATDPDSATRPPRPQSHSPPTVGAQDLPASEYSPPAASGSDVPDDCQSAYKMLLGICTHAAMLLPTPDDPADALLAQTLNADGTPKRPMNAFMIFARKRRPELAAENAAMRTGEISKILSKEWTSMDHVCAPARSADPALLTASPSPTRTTTRSRPKS